MADASLVVETGLAKHCQAQLTRLQMALGLKKEVTADGKAVRSHLSSAIADLSR